MGRAGRTAAYVSLAFHLVTPGCSSVREVPVADAMDSQEPVIAVIYPSGEVVEFDERGGRINTYRGTIDGVTARGTTVSIPLDDTLVVRTNRTDTAKSVAWTVGVLGAMAAVIAVIVHNVSFW